MRLARFARPYVALLLLSILASSVYSGARALRAYLLKPLIDDVAMLGGSAPDASREQDWFSRLIGVGGGEAAPEEAAPPPAPTEERAARQQLAEGVRESFWNIMWAALAIITVIPIAHFASIYLVEYILGRVLVDIQQELCSKLLQLPLGFHNRMSRGERLSRTTNDAINAHGALKLLFGDVVTSVMALLIGSVLLFTISWQLTLCIAVVAPLVAGIIAIFGRRIRLRAERRQQSVGDVTQRLVEILSGIKVIKAFRAQAVESASFRRQNLRLFRRSMSVVRNRAAARTLVEGLNNLVAVGVLVGGASAVWLGLWNLSVGSLGAFVLVLATTYRPVKDLAKGWAQLMDAIPAAERFLELLDTRAELPDAPDAVPMRGLRQGMRVEGVSFSYGREAVLREVSFEVKAGEVVAIVGRTGAGKTTLADLLLRFYDPDAGSIEIDGVDLRRIQRDSLQDQIAVVSQEPFLFAGSIRDNIRYGRPDASADEIDAAARTAHVDEFAAGLPEGYDTEVGEAGAHLSGGQRQRVTIARALLKDPAILIFDEATSSLDAKSERYIQEALAVLLRGRTTFVIAHRLSTIRHADRIVVLDAGRVAAVGSHAELMARDGLYAELVELQDHPAEARAENSGESTSPMGEKPS